MILKQIGARWMVMTLLAGLLATGCGGERQEDRSFPHLPRPIASERILITTAGQSPDGLIAAQLANSLTLSYDYRKKITGDELPGRFSSLIVVIGSSGKGLALANRTEEEELERISALVARASEEEMAVILIHVGGESRRGGFNEELIRTVSSYAGYMIVLRESNRDRLFTGISRERGIPLTVVENIDAIKTPLNSAYR